MVRRVLFLISEAFPMGGAIIELGLKSPRASEPQEGPKAEPPLLPEEDDETAGSKVETPRQSQSERFSGGWIAQVVILLASSAALLRQAISLSI